MVSPNFFWPVGEGGRGTDLLRSILCGYDDRTGKIFCDSVTEVCDDHLIVEMASSSGTGEPSAIPVPAPGSTEQEQKTPAARRNISRSEEDDSDDSGVIRDVARRLTVEAKSPEAEVKKGMESAEAEVSLGSPRSKELIDEKKKEENKEENKDEKKEEKKEEKKPPKKSYLDFIEQKPKPVLRFHVGDLVWGRASGSYYHPAVVTQDPHFK